MADGELVIVSYNNKYSGLRDVDERYGGTEEMEERVGKDLISKPTENYGQKLSSVLFCIF